MMIRSTRKGASSSKNHFRTEATEGLSTIRMSSSTTRRTLSTIDVTSIRIRPCSKVVVKRPMTWHMRSSTRSLKLCNHTPQTSKTLKKVG